MLAWQRGDAIKSDKHLLYVLLSPWLCVWPALFSAVGLRKAENPKETPRRHGENMWNSVQAVTRALDQTGAAMFRFFWNPCTFWLWTLAKQTHRVMRCVLWLIGSMKEQGSSYFVSLCKQRQVTIRCDCILILMWVITVKRFIPWCSWILDFPTTVLVVIQIQQLIVSIATSNSQGLHALCNRNLIINR